jgi:hypothetical protein
MVFRFSHRRSVVNRCFPLLAPTPSLKCSPPPGHFKSSALIYKQRGAEPSSTPRTVSLQATIPQARSYHLKNTRDHDHMFWIVNILLSKDTM